MESSAAENENIEERIEKLRIENEKLEKELKKIYRDRSLYMLGGDILWPEPTKADHKAADGDMSRII